MLASGFEDLDATAPPAFPAPAAEDGLGPPGCGREADVAGGPVVLVVQPT